MSSSVSLGRHRAAPVRNNPLVVISQAVSSNAGSVGRQAAVIAAASGLVLSVGMPAQAETADREANAVTAVTAAQAEAVEVSVPANVKLTFDRASVRSTAAPAVETAAPAQVDEAVAQASEAAEVAAAAEVATETAAEPEPAATPAQDEAAPAPEPKPEPAAASAGNSSVAAAAYAGIGNPYVFGGTSPTAGWDCSGFVQWAYAQAGKSIPRTNQWSVMTPTSNPKPGDLVVQNGGSHVGIYVGNGQMISAMNPSDGTQLHSVSAMSVSGFYTLP